MGIELTEILYDAVDRYGYNEVFEALQKIGRYKGITFCGRDGPLLYIDEYPNAIETPETLLCIEDSGTPSIELDLTAESARFTADGTVGKLIISSDSQIAISAVGLGDR